MEAAQSLLGQHSVIEASQEEGSDDCAEPSAAAAGGAGPSSGAGPQATVGGRQAACGGGAKAGSGESPGGRGRAGGAEERADRDAVLRSVGGAAASQLVRTACRTESGAVAFAVVRAAVGPVAAAQGLELLPDSAVGIPATIDVSAGGFWSGGAGWEAGVVGEVEAPVVFRLVDVEGPARAVASPAGARVGGADADSVWVDAGRGCSVAVLFVDAGVPITPALWRGPQARRR
ncbi:hypothetical protein FNF27_03319 [Cafeteria roenbergensis]|uniref:Uncharacterized protein n=1 Tax=Cafeteria roenbergensis TaxID=33653 RepID=A0A5A8EHQ5_CAFRO|nr:hypothetical protein FNF29_07945 [Cafeteria roenbergensis]KAA0175311.1 hypothetical protein FNF27_03319 [Cafeteria roenbergensis]|eukprot:KAA0146612.1 hypothetical protein FNF29_07945 [Cafeteria roenbergensis]